MTADTADTADFSTNIVAHLRGLAQLADRLDARRAAADARALADRVDAGRCFVACLGQFKRGKSTLINALVGRPVVPTGAIPVTSVVTIVRDAAVPTASVHFTDARIVAVPVAEIAEYVTEAGNPHNHKQVAAVEIAVPSPLLQTGLCLVDTPGVGATPLADASTQRFVPHVDVALLVLGGDPPVSADELALLESVRAETEHLIVVINKADKLADADLIAVDIFTTQRLTECLGRVPDEHFIVSAAERLADGPTRDWSRLEAALRRVGGEKKASLLRGRASRAAARISRELVHVMDESIRALEAPLDIVGARVAQLAQWIHGAQHAAGDVTQLLAAEQRAVMRAMDAEAADRLKDIRARADAELRRGLDDVRTRLGHVSHHEALSIAARVARRVVQEQLDALEVSIGASYKYACERLVASANAFLARLAEHEPALADLPPIDHPETLAARRRFHFTDMMRLTRRTPGDVLVDALASPERRARRIADRASVYLLRLLETNASRAVSDLHDRLEDNRRSLAEEINGRLAMLLESAEHAAARAHAARAGGASAVAVERRRLKDLAAELAELMSRTRA